MAIPGLRDARFAIISMCDRRERFRGRLTFDPAVVIALIVPGVRERAVAVVGMFGTH